MKERSLRVVADDYGLCPEIDGGILELADKGVVQWVSVMTQKDRLGPAARELKARPRVETGIHLNLTDGLPALPAGEVGSLVNRSGRFLGGKHYGVLGRIVTGSFKREEIAAEWRAQIRSALEAGLKVRFLNSHGHLHLVPRLHGIVADLVKEFAIPYVRVVLTPRSVKTRVFDILSRRLLNLFERRSLAVAYPEEILGITFQGALNGKRVLSELGRPVAGRAEFIVHPASKRNAYHDAWGYRTAEEYEGLKDPGVAARLSARAAGRGEGAVRGNGNG